jgi:tetratricopeptide (TPR) repeat protein
MPQLSDLSRIPRRWLVLGLLLLVVLTLGVAAWTTRHRWHKPDPLLTSPTLALEALQATSLYFNNAARPELLAQRRELLTPEDLDEGSPRARGFTQAVQNPKWFRQLDRKYRFDALLLSGDPSQYKPLLDHLVETKDWRLHYADHTSLVFRRDKTRDWELSDYAPVRARLAKLSSYDRATALAWTATKVIAAGYPKPGHQLLEEAVKLSPRNPDSANGLAIYHMGRAEWREAAEQVERALSTDSDFLPALATKAQLLYGTKHFSEAYDISRQLIVRLPQDPVLLFYHAKIAHEAHAYKAEIEALEKLIVWAELEGWPVGGYQVYLGQAYASTGDARRSIDAFMLALNDPDLPNDQRQFIRENIMRIKKRTGL